MDKPEFKSGDVVYWFEMHPDRYEIKSGTVEEKFPIWSGYKIQTDEFETHVHAKYIFSNSQDAEHAAIAYRVDDLEYDIRNLGDEIKIQQLKLRNMRKEQKRLKDKLDGKA